MQTVTTTTNIPQSLAGTVTIIDERERKRFEAEMARAEQWLAERLQRAKREIFSEEVTVSPSIATLLLQRNPDNRNISRIRLAEIRTDILNKDWVFNGESIIVSSDGYLNDGQHRLIACRDTGIGIRTIVVFGVPRKARLTTDQGGARTTANYLSMSGDTENPNVLAAVGRLVLQFDRSGTVRPSHGGGKKNSEKFHPTKTQIMGAVADNRDAILRSIQVCYKKGHKLIGTLSLVSFAHFTLSKIDQVAADTFIGRAIEGVNLSKDDPIYTLRQRFVTDPRMSATDRFEGIIRAWNAYRGNGSLSKIQIMGRVPKVER